MEKDYIAITKSDGTEEKMEVVTTFKLEKTEKNCIIYKNLNEERFFAASYMTN